MAPRRANFPPITPPDQTRRPWTFLDDGSYILFQLDKRKLADQFRRTELLSVPTKRYVGLVLGTFSGEHDSSEEGHFIAFASKSLPPEFECTKKREPFGLPIAPPKGGDIDGRQSLRPKQFPWTDCYQHTVHGTWIVPTHTYPSAIGCKLSKEDFCAFEAFVIEDRAALDRQRELPLKDKAISDIPFPLPVKVWQDLRAASECHDPGEFFEEVEILHRLGLWS